MLFAQSISSIVCQNFTSPAQYLWVVPEVVSGLHDCGGISVSRFILVREHEGLHLLADVCHRHSAVLQQLSQVSNSFVVIALLVCFTYECFYDLQIA